MKTKYKYIHFEKYDSSTKTEIWDCLCNSGKLGIVKWHPGWRQYCYFPEAQAIYSTGCLDDISDFVGQLNRQHKAKK